MLVPKVNAKLVTFDRSVIRRNWSRMNKRPLMRAGLLVRKIARGSIRRQPNRSKYSKPGRPPYSHDSGFAPFKLIYSVPDRLGTSEIVGMVGFGNKAVPGLHEHGGTAPQHVFRAVAGKVKKVRTRTARYPARPFMSPALAKGRSKFPQYWRGALSR